MTGVREVWLFRVDRIEQRTRKRYVRGKGAEAEFADESLGWHVTCGQLTFNLGHDKPDLIVGDTLELRKRES